MWCSRESNCDALEHYHLGWSHVYYINKAFCRISEQMKLWWYHLQSVKLRCVVIIVIIGACLLLKCNIAHIKTHFHKKQTWEFDLCNTTLHIGCESTCYNKFLYRSILTKIHNEFYVFYDNTISILIIYHNHKSKSII